MPKDAKWYWSKRVDLTNSYGYGLNRRTRMVLETIDRLLPQKTNLDVVDFGCADGAMLRGIKLHLGHRFRSGLGVDSFADGIPTNDPANAIRYVRHGFDRHEPLPVEHSSADILVASAFLKHIKNPVRCLDEMSTVLRPGGIGVVLDPCSWVVRVGLRVGRFLGGIHSVWSRSTVESWLREGNINLQVLEYQKYWVAPNYYVYRTGIERILPRFIEQTIALHQCLVLIK